MRDGLGGSTAVYANLRSPEQERSDSYRDFIRSANHRPVLPDVWRTVVDSLATNVAVLDERGVVVAVNQGWSRFGVQNGGEPSLVGVGSDYFAVCDAAAAQEPFAVAAVSALREIVAGERDAFVSEYRCDSPDRQRWFAMRATPCLGGGPGRVVVMHTDITLRRQAEQQVRSQAAILGELDAAVIAMDVDGRVTEWNAGAERLYGWTRLEMLGERSRDRLLPASGADEADKRWAQLESTGRWQGDLEGLHRDGSSVMVNSRIQALDGDDGVREGYVAVTTDISDRLTAQSRMRDAADYLRAVTDSVADGLFVLDREGRVTYANDAAASLLGWSRDQLLGSVMHELTHYRHADGTPYPIADCPIVRACNEDVLARVDDDVFIRYDGKALPVAYTASPFHTDAGVDGAVIVFRDISEEKARQRRIRQTARDYRWAERVRFALEEPSAAMRLDLFAQPIVHIASGSTAAEELLLRMHRDGELIAPAKFLPAATRHGLMPPIDRWVLGEAMRLASPGRPVALNLSSLAFTDFELLAEIENRLDSTGLDPGLLTFEVTETSVIEDHDAASRFLTRLRELGCRIALDDFGTGFSGFTYLKRLPVDYLKIDREFVRDLANNASSHHVVEAVVSLAQLFGHQTVAEGVEDQETLAILEDLGVDYAQGYLLGRPAPAEGPHRIGQRGVAA
jgi:PAS domain S-box-containing protein